MKCSDAWGLCAMVRVQGQISSPHTYPRNVGFPRPVTSLQMRGHEAATVVKSRFYHGLLMCCERSSASKSEARKSEM